MRITYFLCAAMSLSAASSFGQDLKAAEFEAAPAFTETFAGGNPVGQWELDPGNLAGAAAATYVTATPAGVAPAVTALNPVASSSDQAVMFQGNPSSSNGTLFGLNYMRCINSAANGSGTDFTTATKYRVVASVFLFSPSDFANRWQVGPYALGRGSLFRTCSFYNTNATGLGPGFGYRASSAGNALLPGTTGLATSRWTKMSVMVDATNVDPAMWRLAISVDANGDGTLSETDPLEYIALTLAADVTPGPFGMFAVGEVNSDGFPLFTDTVEYYEPLASNVSDWAIY